MFCKRALNLMLIIFATCNSLPFRVNNPGLKVIIDHDGGADDSLAILMALLAEKNDNGPEVLALTTTHGNVDEEQAYINSQKILSLANRLDVPIYRGANRSIILESAQDHFFGFDGLGDVENFEYILRPSEEVHAALALVELAQKYEDELIIISLGALTNIALAIRMDPLLLGRIKQLYIGAGNLNSTDYNHPEYNAKMDVEAYYIAVRDAQPDHVTVVPFSQLATLNISLKWRQETLGGIDTEIITTQNKFESISWSKVENGLWDHLDPVVMAIFLHPPVINSCKFSNNSIILWGDQRGINTNEFLAKENSNVKYIYSLNETAYKNYLLKIFSDS